MCLFHFPPGNPRFYGLALKDNAVEPGAVIKLSEKWKDLKENKQDVDPDRPDLFINVAPCPKGIADWDRLMTEEHPQGKDPADRDRDGTRNGLYEKLAGCSGLQLELGPGEDRVQQAKTKPLLKAYASTASYSEFKDKSDPDKKYAKTRGDTVVDPQSGEFVGKLVNGEIEKPK